jgi:3-hydroxybutyryl-CoA dehydrogenase
MKKINLTTEYKDFEGADLVIECVIEDLDIKREVFKKLEDACNKNAILVSNTSSLSISSISAGLHHPERVAGMHFFNPIHKMELVEIISSKYTSEGVIERLFDISKSIGKIPIRVKDFHGFIVNNLIFSMINEAFIILEMGVAKMEDIDVAMRLGAHLPMGPFELVDLIGLDTSLEIMENLRKNNPRIRIPSILQEKVKKGELGRKTGTGFYSYKKENINK